jgi:DNA-binding XRE family transcriptional regulator
MIKMDKKICKALQEEMGNIRNVLGYTQAEFSDIIGLSRPLISGIENGKKELTVAIARSLVLLLITKIKSHKKLLPILTRLTEVHIYIRDIMDAGPVIKEYRIEVETKYKESLESLKALTM